MDISVHTFFLISFRTKSPDVSRTTPPLSQTYPLFPLPQPPHLPPPRLFLARSLLPPPHLLNNLIPQPPIPTLPSNIKPGLDTPPGNPSPANACPPGEVDVGKIEAVNVGWKDAGDEKDTGEEGVAAGTDEENDGIGWGWSSGFSGRGRGRRYRKRGRYVQKDVD